MNLLPKEIKLMIHKYIHSDKLSKVNIQLLVATHRMRRHLINNPEWMTRASYAHFWKKSLSLWSFAEMIG